ncbi:MAG TPA: gliding motility-associated C-terminal domain-containing protein [Bacteroidales bacterium]|nr:gliding motility-associated C-terminal domain-containing protein [Bacteroidales bacterium]
MGKHLQKIILTLPLLLGILLSYSQAPRPDALCTQVNGDIVTISWKVGGVVPYDSLFLERSYDGTLFSEIGNTLFGAVSFPYTEPSMKGVIYYRLFTVNGPENSDYSDTIRIMFLKVLADPSGSVGQLYWNPVEKSPNGDYSIYRQASGESVWQLIATLQNSTSYEDTIAYPYCSDTLISYQIEYKDPDASCSSWSSVDNATLNEGIPPSAVTMDSVSVSFDGDVTLTWQSLNMKDIMSYIVYHDTVPGGYGPYYACDTLSKNQLIFIDTASYALRKSIGYRVTAVDSCGNESILDVENPLNTLFIDTIPWNYCDTGVHLKWNSAESSMTPPDPDVTYTVYQIDTATYNSRILLNTTSTEVNYKASFKPDSTYCYYVRAVNSNGKSSTSCIQCFTVDRPEQPDTLNLQLASVDTVTNDQIDISAYVDTLPDSTTFVLLRKVTPNDPYDTIRKIKVENTSVLALSDTTAEVDQRAYYYKAVILDGCQNASYLPVNEVRTVYLQGTATDQLNHLYWNRYRSTQSVVTKYRLYRKINGLVDTVFVVGSDTLYDDYIYDQAAGSGRFSYLVEACVVPKNVENPVALSSFSNEIALARTAQLYMPTGFTPNGDGMNDFFAPQNSFPDDQADFMFIIYNRWGQKIYETTSIGDPGWDGTSGGEMCPQGVYVYFIRYVSTEGEPFEKKGTVTLLR